MGDGAQLGEIRRAIDVGLHWGTAKVIYHACPQCGVARWVQLVNGKPRARGQHVGYLCRSCRSKWFGNYMWKGGRFGNSYGYILVHAPSHHRAKHGYVLEHIKVWEETHNKPLPEGWVIHHLNGVRSDNRPRNLLALPVEKHHSHLVNQVLKQRIRELEAEVKLLEKALSDSQMVFRIEEN